VTNDVEPEHKKVALAAVQCFDSGAVWTKRNVWGKSTGKQEKHGCDEDTKHRRTTFSWYVNLLCDTYGRCFNCLSHVRTMKLTNKSQDFERGERGPYQHTIFICFILWYQNLFLNAALFWEFIKFTTPCVGSLKFHWFLLS